MTEERVRDEIVTQRDWAYSQRAKYSKRSHGYHYYDGFIVAMEWVLKYPPFQDVDEDGGEQRAIDAQERGIVKAETDYTGENFRKVH